VSHVNPLQTDMNPNFPKNLAIYPSVGPRCLGESGFGAAAQMNAIEKYGIAGRVWYRRTIVLHALHR
jgi:hypothetical protein